MTSRTAVLRFSPLWVKTLREKLCVMQQEAASRELKDLYGSLIDQLDIYRPVGPNGKHGVGRCTGYCGCEERDALYGD